MDWSESYVFLGVGALLAVVGLALLLLIQRKGTQPTPPVPPPAGAVHLNLSFFFYLSAACFALAAGRAAVYPWSLFGVVAAVVALVFAIRSMRASARRQRNR